MCALTKGGLAPTYSSQLINILSPSKYLLLRNNELLLEPYNGKTKKSLVDRAFATADPRLFNSLPREIRRQTRFYSFKAKGFCSARFFLLLIFADLKYP